LVRVPGRQGTVMKRILVAVAKPPPVRVPEPSR
jgi:hypothetical protein